MLRSFLLMPSAAAVTIPGQYLLVGGLATHTYLMICALIRPGHDMRLIEP